MLYNLLHIGDNELPRPRKNGVDWYANNIIVTSVFRYACLLCHLCVSAVAVLELEGSGTCGEGHNSSWVAWLDSLICILRRF